MRATIRRSSILGATATAMLVLALTTTPSSATTPTASPRVTIDSAPTWTKQAKAIAPTPSTQSQSMTAVLKMRDQAGAEALALAVSDPANAKYGTYLSAAAFRSRFAPTDATVASVVSWLKAQGFTIGSIPANNRYIPFSGNSAQTNKAFATDLKVFSKDGVHVSAPASGVMVPAALAGSIAGIGGLDTSARKTPSHIGAQETGTTGTAATTKSKVATLGAPKAQPKDMLPPPGAVFKNGTPCSSYYGEKAAAVPQILPHPLTYAPCGYKPAQIRGAYGVDAALAQGVDGRGTTVAIVDAFASPYIFKDAQTYAQRNDPSHPLRSYQFSQNLPTMYNSATECDAGGWYGEETLDVEAVHATAPAANILYVGAASCQNPDINAAVNTIVDNQLAQVITNSYGSAGEPTALADIAEEHQTFVQAALEGITVTFSSGDSGDDVLSTGTRQVDYEASDPFVTAVGGTALAIGKTNNYQFEQGWGTGKSVLTNGKWVPTLPAYLYGGGGGTSKLFTQPSYQKKVVPASIANYFGKGAHRAVPDVAMLADPNTGFLVGQSQSFPDGSIKYSEYRIGGTSLSSPLFAGVIAITDQVHQGSLGFLNPKLYQLAGTAAFHDVKGTGVTDGVVRVDFINGLDASGGLRTSLRTLNQTATLKTAVGYDDVTGVGSPNGVNFLIGMASDAKASTVKPGTSTIKHGAPTR